MSKIEKEDLKAMYGSVELSGIIAGLDRQKEVDGKKPYQKEYEGGTKYREIAFNIITNEGESSRVRIKSFKNDFVYYSDKDKNPKKIEWAKRNKLPKDARLYGQISFHGITKKDDGKYETVYKLDYDAIPLLLESFKDGDAVRVAGSIEYNEYNGTTRKNLDLSRMFHSNLEIDFDEDDYTPVRKFKQTIIFEGYDKEKEKDGGRHLVNARVITNKKNGDNVSVDFEINSMNEKMIKAFKTVKAGTELVIKGDFYNKALGVDIEALQDDDEYGFADSDDYAEQAAEYKESVKGYEDVWTIMFVPTKDADGNKLIHTEKYDIDDLDDWKADVLDERENKKNANKKNKGTSKSSKAKVDDDLDDWDDME